MAWHVNEGLAVLIAQARAFWVGITIYTIGDASHSARTSDHNPNSAGRVNAADFMIRGPFSKAMAAFLASMLIKDRRTKYVIYNRRIWQDGSWHAYSGSDPHTDHVHLSVFDSAHTNLSKWRIELMAHTFKKVEGFSLPVLKQGMDDANYGGYNYVWRVQKIVGAEADGVYGPGTAEKIKEWLEDGNGKTVGIEEWRVLYGLAKP